ncbi:DUF4249 domain-containing protein [Spirosoma endbachense]|uniref:DUF4249 family protein n=1 Tax=Spirosoma endbachense TaxID=2666025 RepID=A0A6P1VXP4_9BACT|nr:DUF4249 domain-containing protein [Spirosoma endbachense]QHV97088.1 DUF4249 family protein [Spirosoma endbachense]
MRFPHILFYIGLLVVGLLAACVDPADIIINASVNVLVVDGTITNLPEPQIIRLNRSKADPVTGRFGTTPVTKATVEVVVDSVQVIACHETVDGSYQLPSDFRGQVNHSYQLRFMLSDGTRYVSTQQTMQAVPPINSVSAQFSLTSLPVELQLAGQFRAGHDLFIGLNDPANQHNYYRWEWVLWEKQSWCRSCQQGVYAVNNILPHTYKDRLFYVSGNDTYEDCFVPINYNEAAQPPFPSGLYVYDYPCRTQCWEILYSSSINVFDDQFSNGGQIRGRKVAQIPYYDSTACLVEIRQLALTPKAYSYFKLFQDQTQSTGGLADTPPSAPVGNILNTGDPGEHVVGYFTASGVSTVRYWLDRKDAKGLPFGETDPAGPSKQKDAELFYALKLRQPIPEPIYPYPNIRVLGGPQRPPTALCVPSDSRTPYKPEGWRE